MTIRVFTVGVDSSDLAETALAWTLAAAAESGASVDAIATWQMPLISRLPGQNHEVPTPEFMTEAASASLADAIGRVAEHSAQPVEVEERVVEGKPGPTLVEQSSDSDLLVVGRTGFGKRYGLARFAELTLGSTAKHCVNHASIPIATIPADAAWVSDPTVLVAVEGSPASLAALDWALSELPARSKVHVVRAVEPWIGDGLVPQDVIGNEEVPGEIQDETQTAIDERIGQLDSRPAPPVVETVVASAQRAILHPGYQPDLIVVGKRSRNPVATMVLGSVSDYVVRYAKCPVIVVPTAED